MRCPSPHLASTKYINDIVPGYYVKIDTSLTKKYAVLYVHRPFKSVDGEPQIMVRQIDDDEQFVDNAPPKSVKGERIIEIGGGNNSLCHLVVAWLKEHMGQYFNGVVVDSGTVDGQVDPAHVLEQRNGILDPIKIKSNYQQMSRKFADKCEKDGIIGIRKGRLNWDKITKKSKDPKVPHEIEKQQTGVFKEVTEYDKWINKQFFKSVEILETITEFAEKHESAGSEKSQINPATKRASSTSSHSTRRPSSSTCIARWTGTT